MKTIIQLSLLLILVSLDKTIAQVIPNSDFETWTTTSFQEPNNWTSSNVESFKKVGLPTTNTVTGFAGIAPHMQTRIVGNDTLLGYIYNGPPNVDPISGKGGQPYSQQPANITGYCRYNLIGNDTALILVSFKKNGVVLNQDWIKVRGTGTLSSFTAFTYTLTAPSLTVVPDSVVIAFASSQANNPSVIQNNSYFEVDQIAFTGAGITQTITNGGFENWSMVSYNDVTGWSSAGGGYGGGITKVSPGFSGSSAIELQTKSQQGNYVAQSGITNGQFGQGGPPKFGQPYTLTLDTLYGYYKFSGSNDSGVIFINLSKLHNTVGGSQKYFKAQSNFTKFKIPINSGTAPDSIRIELYSSQPGSTITAAIGSKFTVDYLYLYSSQTLGVNELNSMDKNVAYPNPTNEFLNITTVDKFVGTVDVFDINGRKIFVKDISVQQNEIRLNVAMLIPGMYQLILRNEGSFKNIRFIKE